MTVLNGEVAARWFDPTNEKYASIKDSPLHNKGVHRFTPPGKNSRGENDWVLLLSATK